MRTKLTWDEMAERMGIKRCRGRLSTGHMCHEEHQGQGGITKGVVHWSDDHALVKWQVHWFIRMAARAADPSVDEDIPWRRIYRLAMAERAMARLIHIAPPNRSKDKAFVLAGLAGVGNDVWLRKQAFDWARRGAR